MGNSLSCCVSPNASHKGGKQKHKCKGKVEPEGCEIYVSVAQLLAPPETKEEFFMGTWYSEPLNHISDWEMPQGREVKEVRTLPCDALTLQTPELWVDLGAFSPGLAFFSLGTCGRDFRLTVPYFPTLILSLSHASAFPSLPYLSILGPFNSPIPFGTLHIKSSVPGRVEIYWKFLLHKAGREGYVARVQHLLLGKSGLNDRDEKLRTAVHFACAYGHPRIDASDSDNNTALLKAVQCNQEKCETALLEHGANPNVANARDNTAFHYNKDSLTPLLLAVRERRLEVAKRLEKKQMKSAKDKPRRQIFAYEEKRPKTSQNSHPVLGAEPRTSCMPVLGTEPGTSSMGVEYKMVKLTISNLLKNKDTIQAADVEKGEMRLEKQRTSVLHDTKKPLLVWLNKKHMTVKHDVKKSENCTVIYCKKTSL
ncbi:PREDICTED: ankyrin repeat domain-containing protein 18A-like [Chinchilla lanigera]|uniref:ankyrin repeat domain-containing protein 18A-like n=1 Tax=Chinchilla lanigera TaxID=34839 RepID=UPI00038EB363|nr:PREDICTED: ankyrin repeat domain-containing protein 18A-like [Chinchilla lanigera]